MDNTDVLIQESMDMKKRKDVGALNTIKSTASELDLPITYLSKHVLNTLADNRPHQGILLDCGELPYAALDVLPSVSELMQHATDGAPPPVWLVIDEVSDPVCSILPPFCVLFGTSACTSRKRGSSCTVGPSNIVAVGHGCWSC